ncbi:MAG: hypothetical protein KKB50_09520 [Planctomycetes bacterium]|nr:hypothetical protein [Planctomycetota bacterium]
MPIQFPCPGCAQPIEVDDDIAGLNATCPYCRRVISVPTETTLGAEGIPVAHPVPPAPEPAEQPAASGYERPPATSLPPGDGLHVGPAAMSRRQIAARTYGNYALVCTALVALLFGTMMIMLLSLMVTKLAEGSTSQPTPEQLARIQTELLADLSGNSWYLAGSIGSAFFAVVGLVAAIVSLKQSTQNNWRGIVALILCGLYALCFCGSSILSLTGGA